ncbi:hypothetical protein LMTR13_03240 [Bradyrhizobium icense]|uniref:Uncharacterized protein n=2 Tax=Bradyrhizobium icense TaxID=1274631 RepID=A0A1B1U999_9BRAD|nr:hypothetical protein LMTR13_03240 [Bradyrhizobium icense]
MRLGSMWLATRPITGVGPNTVDPTSQNIEQSSMPIERSVSTLPDWIVSAPISFLDQEHTLQTAKARNLALPGKLSRLESRGAKALSYKPMVTINVNWEYFLAVIGTLVVLAYYANGRFTKLETSVEWMKSAIESLTQHNEAAAIRTHQVHQRTLRD